MDSSKCDVCKVNKSVVILFGNKFCKECKELIMCRKCNKYSCNFILLGGENDPEEATKCTKCGKIYHYDFKKEIYC